MTKHLNFPFQRLEQAVLVPTGTDILEQDPNLPDYAASIRPCGSTELVINFDSAQIFATSSAVLDTTKFAKSYQRKFAPYFRLECSACMVVEDRTSQQGC